MKYYKRIDCRLCLSKGLEKAFELTPTPWADEYVTKELVGKKQDVIPLEIYICKEFQRPNQRIKGAPQGSVANYELLIQFVTVQ